VVGTTTEVTAVTEVDGRRIGNGQVGALTQRLAGLFMERVRRECGIAG
jgi:branched-subunit amino acid aminotransferase/4-amino-4-deoxychorismate lyase